MIKFENGMLVLNSIFTKEDVEQINKYTEYDLKKRFIEVSVSDDDTTNDTLYIYRDIRNKILEVNSDVNYVTDVLVKYLYVEKQSNHKTTLWSCFGDVIVENLKNNLDNESILCEVCGERVEKESNKAKYCEKCAREIKLENDRKLQKLRYNSRK